MKKIEIITTTGKKIIVHCDDYKLYNNSATGVTFTAFHKKEHIGSFYNVQGWQELTEADPKEIRTVEPTIMTRPC